MRALSHPGPGSAGHRRGAPPQWAPGAAPPQRGPPDVSRETKGFGAHLGVFHVKQSRQAGVMVGVDVGTSGLKALLLSPDGRLLASVTRSYPLDVPRPGWAQQDPALWWGATTQAIRALLHKGGIKPSQIAGVGLTGQMHGSVFLDAKGKVL